MNNIRILSHNVFWLQGAPFESDQPGLANNEIVSGLSALYASLDIDLYCLQEIQNQVAADSFGSAIHQAVSYNSGKDLEQYGGLCSSHFEIAPIDTSSMAFNRLCQVIDVSFDQQRLRVANVHLPSNRQLGESASQKKKRAEMSQLLDPHKGITDIDIICGDFNNYAGSDIYQCMLDFGYRDAAEIFGRTDESSIIGDVKRRGDFIWVKEELSPQLMAYEIIPKERLLIENGMKSYLSDHLPVSVTLAFQ